MEDNCCATTALYISGEFTVSYEIAQQRVAEARRKICSVHTNVLDLQNQTGAESAFAGIGYSSRQET